MNHEFTRLQVESKDILTCFGTDSIEKFILKSKQRFLFIVNPYVD